MLSIKDVENVIIQIIIITTRNRKNRNIKRIFIYITHTKKQQVTALIILKVKF